MSSQIAGSMDSQPTATPSSPSMPQASPQAKLPPSASPTPSKRLRGTPRKGKGLSASDRGAQLAAPLNPEDAVFAAQTAQAMCAAAGETFAEQRQWDSSAVVLLDQRLHEIADVITFPSHVAYILHSPVPVTVPLFNVQENTEKYYNSEQSGK